MCGISCTVQFGHNARDSGEAPTTPELEAEMEASLELIKHRGPDSRGIWISKDGAVGISQT